MPNTSITYLRKILSYNPDTGQFTWNENRGSRATKGSIAGTLKDGYVRIGIRIDGKKELLYAHRLAFLFMTGVMPIQIDHLNHNRSDNRWCNLVASTHKQNHHNLPLRASSKTGATGVYFDARRDKYTVRIKLPHVYKFVGYYDKLDDAIKARKQADTMYGYHKNHGT